MRVKAKHGEYEAAQFGVGADDQVFKTLGFHVEDGKIVWVQGDETPAVTVHSQGDSIFLEITSNGWTFTLDEGEWIVRVNDYLAPYSDTDFHRLFEAV